MNIDPFANSNTEGMNLRDLTIDRDSSFNEKFEFSYTEDYKIPSDVSMEALERALDEEVDSLRQDKHLLQSCLQLLQRDYDQLKRTAGEEVSNLRKELDTVSRQNKATQQQLLLQATDLEKVKETNSFLNIEVENYRSENEDLRAQLGGSTISFQDSKIQMQNSLRGLVDEKVILTATIKRMESEMLSTDAEVEALSRQCELLQTQLDATTTEVEVLREEAESMTNQVHTLANEARSQSQKHEAAIKGKDLAIRQLEESIERMTTEVAEAKEAATNTSDECGERDEEGLAVSAIIADLKARLEDTEEKLSETIAQAQLETENKQISLLARQVLENEIASKILIIEQQATQISTLSQNIEFMENEMVVEREIKESLKKDNEHLQVALKSLQGVSDSEKDCHMALLSEKSALLTRLQNALLEVSVEREQRVAACAELSSTVARMEVLQSQLASANSMIEQQAASAETADAELMRLSAAQKLLTMDLQAVEQAKLLAMQELDQLKAAHQEVQSSLLLEKTQRCELETTLTVMQTSDSDQSKLITTLKDHVSDLKTKLQMAQEGQRQAESTVQQLKMELEGTLQQKNDLEMQLQTVQEAAARMEVDSKAAAELSEVQGDEEDGAECVDELQLAVDMEINQLKDSNDTLRAQVEALQEELSRSKTTLIEVMQRSDTMNEVLTSMQRARTQIDIDTVVLKTKLTQTQTAHRKAEEQIIKKKHQIATLEKEVKKFQATVESLEEMLQSVRERYEDQIDDLNQEISDLSEEIDGLRLAQLAADQEALTRITAMEEELQQLKLAEGEVNNELASAKAERGSLMKQLFAANAERSELLTEVEELRVQVPQLAAQVKTVTALKADLDCDLEQLRERLREETQEKEQLTEERMSLKEDVARLESSQTSLLEKLELSESTVSTLKHTVCHLEMSSSDFTDSITKLERHSEELESEKEYLRRELLHLREALRAAENSHKSTIAALMDRLSDEPVSTPLTSSHYLSDSNYHSRSTASTSSNYPTPSPTPTSTVVSAKSRYQRRLDPSSKEAKMWHYSVLLELRQQMELFSRARKLSEDVSDLQALQHRLSQQAQLSPYESKSELGQLWGAAHRRLVQVNKQTVNIEDEINLLAGEIKAIVEECKLIQEDFDSAGYSTSPHGGLLWDHSKTDRRYTGDSFGRK